MAHVDDVQLGAALIGQLDGGHGRPPRGKRRHERAARRRDPPIGQVVHNREVQHARGVRDAQRHGLIAIAQQSDRALAHLTRNRGMRPGTDAGRHRVEAADARFVQADGETRSQGFGLGLAFCKSAIEAHGGTIRAEAGPDSKGTRMVFSLPVNA